MSRRRRRPALRLVVVLLVLVLLVPVLAAVGALVFVNPEAWRPEIEAAALRATGRTLRLGGLSLVPSLLPTVAATDVALANIPGGSRPDMVTVARAEARLALLPLLAGRIEIARLLLLRPDILLETDAAGTPNWRFVTHPPAAAVPAPGAAPPGAMAAPAGGPPAILIRALRIEDGRIGWRDRADAAPTLVELRLLEAEARGLESPVTLGARAAYAGQAIALDAETGPLSRLLDPAAITPWPVKAALETPGARLTASGTIARPLDGAGYRLSVEGAAVSLTALDGLLSTHLPPLRQVAFTARVADAAANPSEAGRMQVTGIAVRAGDSDLDSMLRGLKLTHAELSAAALGEPVRAEAVGTLRGAPLRLTASLGPLANLLRSPARAAPYPVELAGEAAGATLAVKGSVAAPRLLSGIDLAMTARIPDLSALSVLAGRRLPALRPVTLDARVADREGGPGVAIRGLAVTAPEADVSGELVLGLAARPAIQATLASRRIDLDAILAALPPKSLPPMPAPESAPPNAVPPDAAPPPPKLPPPGAARLIPDGKLPFAALDVADADLRVSVGELRGGGASYRDLAVRLLLQDGRLVLDPATGSLPGGRLDIRLSADSRAVPPPAALSLRASGLALRPLLAALHVPGDIGGAADIDADLRGAGDTPRALAAGLGGRLGIAMTDGDLDNRLFGGIVAALLAGPQVPAELLGLDHPGRTRIRCLAVRADADNGLVNLSTLLLDTGRVLVHGAGTVNLRDEAIALRLRPMLRVGAPLVVPVRVGGTLLAPKIAADQPAAAGAATGLAAGLAGVPLGVLSAVIANERGGDVCAPALAAAHAGPRPPPPPAPPKGPNPAELLRGLLPR
jgi:AsmA protein